MHEPSDIHRIFKVIAQSAWDEACREGAFAGSADDLRDGYIHLSTGRQVAETLAKHFKGQSDLVLVEIDARALGDSLRWEPSRGGALFPHLYGPLPMAAARSVQKLTLGPAGVPLPSGGIALC